MARAQFALKGQDIEIGSVRETLAMKALRQQNTAMYVQTLALVQAITYGAGAIMAAVAGGDAQPPSPDDLNKTMGNLLNLLLPSKDEKDENAERAKKMMEAEIEKGPFKVEGMSYNKPKRKR